MLSDLLFAKDVILLLGLGDEKSKQKIIWPKIESGSSVVVLETIQADESFQLVLIFKCWAEWTYLTLFGFLMNFGKLRTKKLAYRTIDPIWTTNST